MFISVNVRIILGTDFLCPQPQLPSTPDIFLIGHALHNQPDKYANMLLSHLRKIATKSTKLIIIDFFIDHACVVPENSEYAVPGGPSPIAPTPLLPNYGAAAAYPYYMDMVVCDAY